LATYSDDTAPLEFSPIVNASTNVLSIGLPANTYAVAATVSVTIYATPDAPEWKVSCDMRDGTSTSTVFLDTHHWDVTPDFNAPGAPGAEADTDLSFHEAFTANTPTTLSIACQAVGGSAASGFSTAPLPSSSVQATMTALDSDDDIPAEQLADTAQAAAIDYGVTQGGSYSGLTLSVLKSLNPAIAIDPGSGGPYMVSAFGSPNTFSVTAVSVDGDTYSIDQTNGGTFRTCTSMPGISFECDNGVW
jgi:hypothetical protein